MTAAVKDARLKRLLRYARSSGASQAEIIDAKRIVVDERVRLKCMIPLCDSYGRHLMCPPNVPTVEEFANVLKLYTRALIVQIETDYDSADEMGMHLSRETCEEREELTGTRGWKVKLHRLVNEVEAAAFKEGFYLAAGLIGGTCNLCSVCVGSKSGKACRHPFEARPSMEAVGIDVVRTCRNAGLALRLSSVEHVRWTGLLLLD